MLILITSVLLGDFAASLLIMIRHSSFKTKLACLLRIWNKQNCLFINTTSVYIAQYLLQLYLNLSVVTVQLHLRNRLFVSVFTKLFKIANKSLNGYFLECSIFMCNIL